jgi:hypothetical protein
MKRTAFGILMSVAVLLAPSSAQAAPNPGIEGFARFGDCVSTSDPGPCHFMSASADRSLVQVEFTKTDEGVYLRDVLCNVLHPKVRINRHKGFIEFDGTIPAADCEFLIGDEQPHDFDVRLTWMAVSPPVSPGSEDCIATAVVDGQFPGDLLFCSILGFSK